MHSVELEHPTSAAFAPWQPQSEPNTPNKSSKILGVRSFYSCYYGCAQSFILPYLPLFFNAAGITGSRMSLIIMMTPLANVVTLPLGFVADRHKAIRLLMTLCSTFACLFMASLLFMSSYTTMILVYAGYAIFNAPLISLADSLAVSEAIEKKTTYSALRIYGSISFTIISLIFGQVLDRLNSPDLIVIGASSGFFLAIFAAFLQRPSYSDSLEIPRISDAFKLISNKIILFFLVAGALHWASLGSYMAFLSVHLENIGQPVTISSYCWAVAVSAEILVMLLFKKLKQRVSDSKDAWTWLIFFSIIVGSVRWFITARFAHIAVLVVGAQSIHGFTFGLFHCSAAEFLENVVPGKLRSTGRALYTSVVMGVGGVLGIYISGKFWDIGQGRAAFESSAVLELVAPFFIVIMWLFQRKNTIVVEV
ncbi:hypothetical protein RCL1_000398 [Eukaryota sp. TZLM3-RCL]